MIAEIKRRNVGYIPTLTRDLSVFVYESTPPYFSDPFFLRHVAAYRAQMTQLSDPAAQQRMRNNAQAQSIKQALQQANRNLKLLSDAGVTIAMGTDSGAAVGRWQGYFEHTTGNDGQAGSRRCKRWCRDGQRRVMKLIRPGLACNAAMRPTWWC